MDILPELRKRKSPLFFDKRDVEKEKIELLIEAARWAPSCSNNQSWNYVFVHKYHVTRSALEDAFSRGNKWAKTAPYIVAVGANPEEDCQTNNLPYYSYNAGLSVMCLVIEAEHQGLRVRQMAGWNESTVKKAVGFPKNIRVIVLFALGYESDIQSIWNTLEERDKDKIVKTRERKASHENFFFEIFNNPKNKKREIKAK